MPRKLSNPFPPSKVRAIALENPDVGRARGRHVYEMVSQVLTEFVVDLAREAMKHQAWDGKEAAKLDPESISAAIRANDAYAFLRDNLEALEAASRVSKPRRPRKRKRPAEAADAGAGDKEGGAGAVELARAVMAHRASGAAGDSEAGAAAGSEAGAAASGSDDDFDL